MMLDGALVTVACYHTALVSDGLWVTVRWDAVELAKDVDPDGITVVEEDEEFFENPVRKAEAAAEAWSDGRWTQPRHPQEKCFSVAMDLYTSCIAC